MLPENVQSGCHSGPDGIQKYQSDFLIKSIDDSKVAILPDTGKSCQFSKGGTAYEHRIWQEILPYDIHDAVGEKDFCTRQAVVEWLEFMMHDAVSLANWPTLLALFPEFQLTVQLGTEVIASLNSIPLAAPPVSQLDDGGWDWALETGISGKRVERPANCLCGLQIGICREMQGKGLAGMMIAL